METYVQVGVMALRSPDGEFLPAVPVHARVEPPAALEGAETVAAIMESHALNRVARLFAEKHREYVQGVEALEGSAAK